MDELFEELVGVNHVTAFKFFSQGLQSIAHIRGLRSEETAYVASILAHYAQTSCFDQSSMPCMTGLSGVFDQFVLQGFGMSDAEILEIAGSQVLLFAGFFRDQMKHRHNVRWYDQLGQSFYEKASRYSRERKKSELLEHIAESFPTWTITCRNLSKKLREDRFVIKLD